MSISGVISCVITIALWLGLLSHGQGQTKSSRALRLLFLFCFFLLLALFFLLFSFFLLLLALLFQFFFLLFLLFFLLLTLLLIFARADWCVVPINSVTRLSDSHGVSLVFFAAGHKRWRQPLPRVLDRKLLFLFAVLARSFACDVD